MNTFLSLSFCIFFFFPDLLVFDVDLTYFLSVPPWLPNGFFHLLGFPSTTSVSSFSVSSSVVYLLHVDVPQGSISCSFPVLPYVLSLSGLIQTYDFNGNNLLVTRNSSHLVQNTVLSPPCEFPTGLSWIPQSKPLPRFSLLSQDECHHHLPIV